MHKYEIIIYWSNEDQIFVAEVPELPGCMAHGNTQEAALAQANEAIQLWIDTAREFGDPVPQPKGERLMLAEIYIPPANRHRIAMLNVHHRDAVDCR
jgi:predicted RNase H-like HicB family nuclease